MQTPSQHAQAYSQQLTAHMRDLIQQQGPIPFAQFMEMALYTPNLGYYQNGLQKFGPQGDFITAPEISPLFGACLAEQIAAIFSHLPDADILEFGAGSGQLAVDVLLALQNLNALPKQYYILELSAELKTRQQTVLQERLPDFYEKIIWLETLPTTFKGVIVANEVLDAMPVHRFLLEENTWFEYHVDWDKNKFVEKLLSPTPRLQEKMHVLNSVLSKPALLPAGCPRCEDALKLDSRLRGNDGQGVEDGNGSQEREERLGKMSNLEGHYSSEINLHLAPWLTSLSHMLERGVLLLMDYGFPQREYYHPDRNMGTLMCHYQHHAHTDPYFWPGLQDITAHVDFTAVAEAGFDAGFTVAGYTTQAHFLLACRITELAANLTGSLEQQYATSQGIKKLLLPSEMGELFKVMALTKNFSEPLIGFSIQDMRAKL